MVKISAVVITHNEERNIGRCLESLKGVADEVVVVDSYSTDGTEAICSRYTNVRFIQYAWAGYGAQKNYGNQYAENDYILSMDADEALSDELKKLILSIKEAPQADAYSFNRLNIYCGKAIRHCGWYPDRKIRLWDKTKGEWNSSPVHELVEMQPEYSHQIIKGDLLHYSYNTVEEHVRKVNHYTNIWLEKAVKNGKKTSFVKMVLAFKWRFFHDYFLKLGILDGVYGFTICAISAYEAFLKYCKLYQRNRSDKLMSGKDVFRGQ